jgi:hypothetical protein
MLQERRQEMKRRNVIIVGSVAGAVLLAAVLVGSVGARAWGSGRGFHGCGWGHPGFGGGKGVAEFVVWRMDKAVKDLNLTPVQKEKYDKLRSGITSHMAEAAKEHWALREEVHGEMAKDVPDIAVVAPKLKKAINDISMDLQGNIDLVTAFYGSLNDTQKKKLVADIHDRMERRGHHGY